MSDETQELPEIDESVTGGTDDTVDASAKAVPVTAAMVGDPDLGLVMDVPLHLSVELGSTRLPVRDVLALAKGSVVELNRMNGEPADIYVNDRLIARGEISNDDERVAVRITELVAVKKATNPA